MDVLFVDFPYSFLFPVKEWCLGYRCMIATLRESGFTATVIHPQRCRGDADGVRKQLIKEILAANTSILGFTTYDVKLADLLTFIHELRQAGVSSHITLGGMCASAIPALLLQQYPEIDSVVVGEGEMSIVDLARLIIRREKLSNIPGVWRRCNGQILAAEPRPLIEDLDALPKPALADLDGEGSDDAHTFSLANGCVPVVASRGCYGRCTFCCIHNFYRMCPGHVWRGRNAASIVDEVVSTLDKTGLKRVTFVDENFMGPGTKGRRHATAIAQELMLRSSKLEFNFGCRANDVERSTFQTLKTAGLAATTLGIESMSRAALTLFNKGNSPETNWAAIQLLEELQIPTEITFIFFQPLTTLTEITENLNFVHYVSKSKYAYFNYMQPFSEFIPFFGTALTAHFTQLGLTTRTLEGYSIHYADPRVALIARKVLDVPVDLLSKLRSVISQSNGPRLTDVVTFLANYEFHLNMFRLPELVSDLCNQFERSTAPPSCKIERILREFDKETNKIHRLIELFLSYLS